jgi:Uma2 family endonuclease
MSIAQKYRPNYSYADYCQWEGKWELIDGMPYAMSPSPIPEHQRSCLKICLAFEAALTKCNECKVYPPLDWKVNEHTVLQPDVVIVCKEITGKYLNFPPSVAVEVLSPSTALKDRNEKYEIYQQQKVRYYIIADPIIHKLEIYELVTNVYQPVALSPLKHIFTLTNNCQALVSFADIWN